MYARVGTGAVDWKGWASTLRDINYTGWAIIELDASADPAGDLRGAREYIENNALSEYLR
jgi:sugar phosphate isomerase/epimerase